MGAGTLISGVRAGQSGSVEFSFLSGWRVGGSFARGEFPLVLGVLGWIGLDWTGLVGEAFGAVAQDSVCMVLVSEVVSLFRVALDWILVPGERYQRLGLLRCGKEQGSRHIVDGVLFAEVDGPLRRFYVGVLGGPFGWERCR